LDWETASSDADDSGIGELTGAWADSSLTAETDGSGTSGGVGSLARGTVTEVSPVNGFLYSDWDVITDTEDGL
jgi:hypothetical protein